MRVFETGATRDVNDDKLAYEGFESALVTKRYAQYMHLHRHQADGKLRDPDNWQKGIPKAAYVDSLVRHVQDLRLHWDGAADEAVDRDFESVLCAILFNAKGLLFETLKEKRGQKPHFLSGMTVNPQKIDSGSLGGGQVSGISGPWNASTSTSGKP